MLWGYGPILSSDQFDVNDLFVAQEKVRPP